MNEEEIRKIIEESEILTPYLRTMPSMTSYSLDSEQAIERYKKDKALNEENNYYASVFQCAFDKASWLSGSGGTFSSYQCMTPEAHKNTFINLNFAQLLSSSQAIRQEIERINDAKPLLSKLIDANAKAQWDRNYSITLETANKSSSWNERDWDSHITKNKAKQAVLDMAILLYEKILAVYDAEISERKQAPKVKEIIKNMSSLVKQAEKTLLTIGKANQKAQKALEHGIRPDLKTCNNFIDATAEFSELSHQYSIHQNQLDFYTNESSNDLAFPALTSNDTSAEYEIKREWRKFV
jgi:hypothetical protein